MLVRDLMILASGVVLCSSAGCTVVEPDDSNPFGTNVGPMNPTNAGTGSGDDEDSDSASEGTGAGSSSGEASTEAPASSSAEDTGTAGTTSTDDSGGGDGAQPDMGMYSACTVPEDCGFSPTLCITINDMGGAVLDGFCSELACLNAAADCDPSPGGTASPICISVMVDGAPDTACALNCSAGATCPIGMTCYNLTGIGEVCG